MPINPHSDPIAATHWFDQFGAEIVDRAQGTMEALLHRKGLCTSTMDATLVELLDTALETGAVTMAVLLEEKGRLKEVED